MADLPNDWDSYGSTSFPFHKIDLFKEVIDLLYERDFKIRWVTATTDMTMLVAYDDAVNSYKLEVDDDITAVGLMRMNKETKVKSFYDWNMYQLTKWENP